MSTELVLLQSEVGVLSGFAWKSSKFKTDPCGLPIVRIQNVGTDREAGFVYWNDDFNDRFVVTEGELLLTLSGSFRLAEWKGVDALLNQRILKLSPSANLDRRFFLNYMQTQLERIERMGKHALVNNVSVTDIKNLQIPLPPLAEQKRIAGILDAADALRAKRRESLAQLDTLLRSTFLDMFGDPVTNPKCWRMGCLSDVVERLDGGKNVAQSETATDFRVLKVSAVTYGEYRPEESKYLPADFEVPESYLVCNGDLLISRANTAELIGATAYVWETPENIALPDKIWKFIWKTNAEIEPLFIYHLSQDAEFRRILGSRSSGTSGSMKNIAKPKLLGLPIPLPPLDLQQRFAAIVESIEHQKASQRAHLDQLDTLFASLQSRAFKGELAGCSESREKLDGLEG